LLRALGAFSIRTEENSRPENPFKCLDQDAGTPCLLSHAEGLEHLRGALEAQHRAFPSDRYGREKDGHDPVLSEGNAKIRMAGHLESEPPVSTFVGVDAEPTDRIGRTAAM
jgi:hypothetical protein